MGFSRFSSTFIVYFVLNILIFSFPWKLLLALLKYKASTDFSQPEAYLGPKLLFQSVKIVSCENS